MTTNNQCNHAEAIAREMHMYYAAQAHNESNTPIPHWADLTENDQQGWIAVANTALPIIVEQGHISYSQALPETDVPPVVQIVPSKT